MNTENTDTFTYEDMLLYRDCPRCFFLHRKHNIMRPGKIEMTPTVIDDELDLSEEMKKSLENGAPLQNINCVYCKYRQLVRGTGIENELTA